jgi:hypothetical protein
VALRSLSSRSLGGPVREERPVSMATGALPPRDPALARLENWIEEFLVVNDREPALRTFAHRIVLRRCRRRSHKAPLTASALSRARTELGSASAFIDWLATRDTPMGGCCQADIDAWLAGSRPDRHVARSLARWAIDRRLMPKLEFPTSNRGGPTAPIIDQDLIELARRLLHDPLITTRDRIAGSLVVLFAQPVIRVARLTVDDITIDTDTVAIRLGSTAIVVPDHSPASSAAWSLTAAAAPPPSSTSRSGCSAAESQAGRSTSKSSAAG